MGAYTANRPMIVQGWAATSIMGAAAMAILVAITLVRTERAGSLLFVIPA